MMKQTLSLAVSLLFSFATAEAQSFKHPPIKLPAKAPEKTSAKTKLLESADTEINPAFVELYARQLASVLAGRPLTKAERNKIKEDNIDAIAPMLKTWLQSPFFAQSFRTRVEMLIGSSGEKDGVDWNLPGNLASYIITQKLPLETLLTADFCIDGQGQKIKCDSGAPYDAGVLTTRGFLIGHAGRFNLGRASSMMGAFACEHYPMSPKLQPQTPKEDLIENFRILTEEDAAKVGATGFGNGAACYMCHSQFAPHSQFFVKFDDKGIWKAEATGAPSDTLEFGRSDNGFFQSHMVDPKKAAEEKSNMFGKDADNLAAAAKILTSSDAFLECMAKNAITHGLNLDSEATKKITAEALQEVIKDVPKSKAKVTDLYEAVLVHPIVINAFAKGVGE